MLTIMPIGTVRNEVKTPVLKGWSRVVSNLVVDERYTDAIDGPRRLFARPGNFLD